MNRHDEQENGPHRLALFRCQRFGTTIALEQRARDPERPPIDGYTRISEWQDVTFKPLSHEEIVGTELVSLTKLRESVVAEFSQRLGDIDGRMANLRALTAPVSV